MKTNAKPLVTAIAVAHLLLIGCATTQPQPSAANHRLDRALLWTVDSAEYRAATIQAFALARERVEELAEGREPGTWAVSVDADETILDNSPYNVRRAEQGTHSFDWESWNAWCREISAELIPGSLAFLNRVRELGGRIAVVTNRREDVRDVTRDNLEKRNVPFDLLLVRQQDGPGDKEPRWNSVENGTASPELGPLEVVMWVGDNVGDFPNLDQELRHRGEDAFNLFGKSYFVIPNPVYGSWQRNRKE